MPWQGFEWLDERRAIQCSKGRCVLLMREPEVRERIVRITEDDDTWILSQSHASRYPKDW